MFLLDEHTLDQSIKNYTNCIVSRSKANYKGPERRKIDRLSNTLNMLQKDVDKKLNLN